MAQEIVTGCSTRKNTVPDLGANVGVSAGLRLSVNSTPCTLPMLPLGLYVPVVSFTVVEVHAATVTLLAAETTCPSVDCTV